MLNHKSEQGYKVVSVFPTPGASVPSLTVVCSERVQDACDDNVPLTHPNPLDGNTLIKLCDEQILTLVKEVAKSCRYLKVRDPQDTVEMVKFRFGMCEHPSVRCEELASVYGMSGGGVRERTDKVLERIPRKFSDCDVKIEFFPSLMATCLKLPPALL